MTKKGDKAALLLAVLLTVIPITLLLLCAWFWHFHARKRMHVEIRVDQESNISDGDSEKDSFQLPHAPFDRPYVAVTVPPYPPPAEPAPVGANLQWVPLTSQAPPPPPPYEPQDIHPSQVTVALAQLPAAIANVLSREDDSPPFGFGADVPAKLYRRGHFDSSGSSSSIISSSGSSSLSITHPRPPDAHQQWVSVPTSYPSLNVYPGSRGPRIQVFEPRQSTAWSRPRKNGGTVQSARDMKFGDNLEPSRRPRRRRESRKHSHRMSANGMPVPSAAAFRPAPINRHYPYELAGDNTETHSVDTPPRWPRALQRPQPPTSFPSTLGTYTDGTSFSSSAAELASKSTSPHRRRRRRREEHYSKRSNGRCPVCKRETAARMPRGDGASNSGREVVFRRFLGDEFADGFAPGRICRRCQDGGLYVRGKGVGNEVGVPAGEHLIGRKSKRRR